MKIRSVILCNKFSVCMRVCVFLVSIDRLRQRTNERTLVEAGKSEVERFPTRTPWGLLMFFFVSIDRSHRLADEETPIGAGNTAHNFF